MISERIRKVRGARSRKAFGEKMFVSQDVINNIERGRVEPSDMIIKAICKTYHVNENWLRTGEGGNDPVMDEPSHAALDQVADQYNLGELERIILETFITMPESDRRAFADIVHRAAERINNADYRDMMNTDVNAAISEAKKQSAEQAAQAQTE